MLKKMGRMFSLIALCIAVNVAAASQSELAFDPYTGETTTSTTSEVNSSTFSANLTPSGGDSMTASPLGLTPGFWKQKHHFFAWNEYETTDNYWEVFGLTPPNSSNFTLLQALSTGGGGEKALGRHAVAALLNASSPYVNYPFTEEQIFNMVQNAYLSKDFEATKNLLEAANEAGGEFPKNQ
jgi:hypothetical protein